jgi:hypothetical protein
LKFSVGRSRHNDVVFPDDSSVSRTAFVFWPLGQNRIQISGIHLANGMLINNRPVSGDSVIAGQDDRIEFGGVTTSAGELLQKVGRKVFVSYARSDRDRARAITGSLREYGWPVWWDDRLKVAEAFDEQIERHLREARCVVVLWSHASVKSQWVRAEAGLALEEQKLVPLFIDKVEPPLQFRQIQGAFATDWQGTVLASDLKPFLHAVEELIGSPIW